MNGVQEVVGSNPTAPTRYEFRPFSPQPALHRYLLHFRPEPALPQYDYVFLQRDGCPLAKGAMVTVARRVTRKTGIERFHWHLLRHTFAVNYLVNGGDAFSLQRILGHTTLEMVRRYMHLADVHVRLQHRRYSPMDVMQAALRFKVAAQ